MNYLRNTAISRTRRIIDSGAHIARKEENKYGRYDVGRKIFKAGRRGSKRVQFFHSL